MTTNEITHTAGLLRAIQEAFHVTRIFSEVDQRTVASTWARGGTPERSGISEERMESDARRLATCWNACDGIATEALEAHGAGCFAAWAVHAKRADDAASLLQRCESFIRGFEDDELQEGIPELLADLRAELRTAMCAELESYCKSHGLPLSSADDIAAGEGDSSPHKAWMLEYCDRWDAIQDPAEDHTPAHNPRTPLAMPSDLASQGYRLEFGDDQSAEDLRGRYWWTLTRAGWMECESGDDYATADEAISAARADYAEELARGPEAFQP